MRRKFFDVHAATGSPIAKEALDRIGQLYAVDKMINGLPPERRRQRRQLHSKPIAQALAAWAESTVRQLSRKSELAQAFRYMRARWTALVRCFDDGRLALDNNPAERALRCVAQCSDAYLIEWQGAGYSGPVHDPARSEISKSPTVLLGYLDIPGGYYPWSFSPPVRNKAQRICASHDPEKVKVNSILHGFGLSTTDPTPRADRRRRRRRRNRN